MTKLIEMTEEERRLVNRARELGANVILLPQPEDIATLVGESIDFLRSGEIKGGEPYQAAVCAVRAIRETLFLRVIEWMALGRREELDRLLHLFVGVLRERELLPISLTVVAAELSVAESYIQLLGCVQSTCELISVYFKGGTSNVLGRMIHCSDWFEILVSLSERVVPLTNLIDQHLSQMDADRIVALLRFLLNQGLIERRDTEESGEAYAVTYLGSKIANQAFRG